MTWTLADTDQSIPRRFEQIVRLHPQRTAIDGTDWSPTYAQLDAAADGIARKLVERGAGRGKRVALAMGHDAPLIAATIAVLKTGAAAVVLNAGDPAARLGALLADVEPLLTVTDSERRGLVVAAGRGDDAILTVDARPAALVGTRLDVAVDADELALLICTSGSTGTPVAVRQPHRHVLHNVLRHSNGLGITGADRIVLLASPSGGQGTGTMWTALLNGATLCPYSAADRGVAGLAAWLERHAITVFVSSASLFRHFARTLDGARLPAIRLVRLGSERALRGDWELWREHFARGCEFANTYSSSETGNIARLTIGVGEVPGAGSCMAAGRAAEGIEIALCDEQGNASAPGDVGEIVVRSRFLSPGYWRREALTAERLRDLGDGVREFRTGDLGAFDGDGLLVVHGRRDGIVKIRGNRVSLTEVEAALGRADGVVAAAVRPRVSAAGDASLAAYVVRSGEDEPTVADLRAALRARLPDHAVPTQFAFLAELPLGQHGKVDSEHLAQIAIEPQRANGSAASASGASERLIASLFSQALGVEDVARDEDFFDLGGDSLAAAEVAVGIDRALGARIELAAFAREPTVAALARIADGGGGGESTSRPSPVRRGAREALPASLAQERIWRACQTSPEQAAGYVVAAALSLSGSLDVDALRAGVERIVARHEALRTTFQERDGALTQVVNPAGDVDFELADVSAEADPRANARALLERGARRGFDLRRGPLVRFALVRIGVDEHELHRFNHHIISDGESWALFLDELEALYRPDPGRRLGRVPDLPIQYGDFAAWEHGRVGPGGEVRGELLDWWRGFLDAQIAPAPFARETPALAAAPGEGTILWGLEPSVGESLERLQREAGATRYMARLAGFAALLGAECASEQAIVSTYVSTRRQPETRVLFGCFTHLALVRIDLGADPSVRELLARVREAVLDTNDHGELAFEAAAEELASEGERLPGAAVLFAQKEKRPPRTFAGVSLSAPEHSIAHHMPSGFSFLVDRWQEHDACRVDFDATVYDPERVRAFVERYRRLMGELALDPDRRLGEVLAASGAGDAGAESRQRHGDSTAGGQAPPAAQTGTAVDAATTASRVPGAAAAPEPYTLVVRAWNGGFFSHLNRVVNHLHHTLERDGCVAVRVDWRVDAEIPLFAYGTAADGELWQRFFEPLALADAPADERVSWQYADLAMTGLHAYRMYKRGSAWRRAYGRAFAQHVRVREQLRRRERELWRDAGAPRRAVGVHYRHPQHGHECPREIPPLHVFVERARSLAAGDRSTAIVLATDVQEAVAAFAAQFGDRLIVQPDVARTSEHRDQHAHVSTPGIELGEQALIDALLLARCQTLLHTVSNLATAVGYMNTQLRMVYCESRLLGAAATVRARLSPRRTATEAGVSRRPPGGAGA